MNRTILTFSRWVAVSAVAVVVAVAPALASSYDKEGAPVIRTPLLLLNADFENGLESWETSPKDAQAYAFAVDTEIFRTGKQSIRIRSLAGERGGAIYQVLPAAALRGKTVELSGWLKTDEVAIDGAVLTLRALGGARLLEYNVMRKAPVKGTTEWTRYSIALKLSKNVSDLEVGVALNSKGTVWADDLELNVVSHHR
ncbi:MAG: hypothetical protein LBE75_00660 [Burkholderiales bacterium]|jgi:hypothetical protein|nr:hypothetical protein [Burkholderiales bacterium]